jgi:hypothetical protein
MNGMFPVKRTIFLELQLFLYVSPVLFGGVVAPLALATLKRDQFNRTLLL